MRALALAVLLLAVSLRLWNALTTPLLLGYDALGHVSYVFFLDLYHALPWADQGWSYFHPPLHYAVGWLFAQLGSATAFVRGWLLWNAAASLMIAALSAMCVRAECPGRAGPALAAFVLVAFLPVHIYTSAMPGNELTAALFSTAGVAHFVTCERRAAHPLRADVVAGLWFGMGLLAKYSALIPLLAVAGALLLTASAIDRSARLRAFVRVAVIVGVAFLVASPYYVRNITEFGTPFPLSGHRPVVDVVEATQPPGARGLFDLVRVSPRLFSDPDPRAPHMLHSIWGTLYASLWVYEDPEQPDLSLAKRRALAALGVWPTAVAWLGAGVVVSGLVRRRRDPVAAMFMLLALYGLVASALFAFVTPTFAALKASYLLNTTPAFGYFFARVWAGASTRAARISGSVALGMVVVCAGFYARGLSLPRTSVTAQMAVVHTYFGEHAAARSIYERTAAGARRFNPRWLDGMIAGVDLESGDAVRAAKRYARSLAARQAAGRVGPEEVSPFVLNRVAVAMALAGNVSQAREIFDTAIERDPLPELRASRAALFAEVGNVEEATRELAGVLLERPSLAAALHSAAALAARRDDPNAESLQQRAEAAARRAPRGYPYGAGDGRGFNTQLYMLVVGSAGLDLYRPGRARF